MPKLSKGRLVKINWGKHEQQIKEIWETKPSFRSGSLKSKVAKIQRLVGYSSNLVGLCQCKALNTHILYTKVEGACVISRYCEKHLP